MKCRNNFVSDLQIHLCLGWWVVSLVIWGESFWVQGNANLVKSNQSDSLWSKLLRRLTNCRLPAFRLEGPLLLCQPPAWEGHAIKAVENSFRMGKFWPLQTPPGGWFWSSSIWRMQEGRGKLFHSKRSLVFPRTEIKGLLQNRVTLYVVLLFPRLLGVVSFYILQCSKVYLLVQQVFYFVLNVRYMLFGNTVNDALQLCWFQKAFGDDAKLLIRFWMFSGQYFLTVYASSCFCYFHFYSDLAIKIPVHVCLRWKTSKIPDACL